MKKISLALIILIIFLGLFIYFNVSIYNNTIRNEKVIKAVNNLFPNKEVTIYEKNELTSMEFDKKDYVGLLSILSISKIIPVESTCSNSYFEIQSMCSLKKDQLVMIGTNLNDSLPSYKNIIVGEVITFTDMLGKNYEFKIEKMENVKNLDNISLEDDKIILIIKNYFELSYTLFIGN